MSELDRILLESDEVGPSPGFTASVMRAVRSSTPDADPIRFPWVPVTVATVLAVVVSCLVVLVVGTNGLGDSAANILQDKWFWLLTVLGFSLLGTFVPMQFLDT